MTRSAREELLTAALFVPDTYTYYIVISLAELLLGRTTVGLVMRHQPNQESKRMNLQMNLQQWSYVAEIVASVAVVLSLCFLAYEIRVHTLQSRKDSMDLVTSRRFDLLRTLAVDGELAAIVWKGLAGKPRLPADEWARYSLYVYTLLLEFERAWLKAKSGSIDDEAWSNWEQAMAWWLQHPGLHAWWRADPPGFGPRFTVYLEEKMTQSRVNPLVSATVAAAFRERERLTQPVPTPAPAPQPATVPAAEPPDQSPPGLG